MTPPAVSFVNELWAGPLLSSCVEYAWCSTFLVPSTSPDPFFGSGGHQVCGAGIRSQTYTETATFIFRLPIF